MVLILTVIGKVLKELAELVDAGKDQELFAEELEVGILNGLRKEHQTIEGGRIMGKVTLVLMLRLRVGTLHLRNLREYVPVYHAQ